MVDGIGEGSLNGGEIGLNLPSVEWGSVVGEGDFPVRHGIFGRYHGGHRGCIGEAVAGGFDSFIYIGLQMRFRAKFGLLGWSCVALALLVLVLWFSSGYHNETLGILATTLPILAAIEILKEVFIYWELDADGLCERRFWTEKKIPWQEVIRVSAWNSEQPSSDFLAIDYARSAPMSDRGSVIANPEDRQRFLADLYRYAPQAAFEV